MMVPDISSLIRALGEFPLLSAAQMQQLTLDLMPRFNDVDALLRELIGRGFLTDFQVKRIGAGQIRSLIFGDYVLLDRLGAGGMGEVYMARQRLMGEVHALKVIRPQLLVNAESTRRFLHEIQAAAQVSHPNIVAARYASQVNGAYFLAMEYIEGIDLEKYVGQCGRVPMPEACDYLCQAAAGLQHAHERGLVHRDIKPSNLLRAHSGQIKILDMGLARLRASVDGQAQASQLTQQGVALGTPNYIAPEQISDSRSADIRADIYSLGCSAFHLLTGQVPFHAPSLIDLYFHHKYTPPPSVLAYCSGVPRELDEILRRMMAKQPDMRFPSPVDVLAALAPYSRNGAPVQRIPISSKVQPALPVQEPARHERTEAQGHSNRRSPPLAEAADPTPHEPVIVSTPRGRKPVAAPRRRSLWNRPGLLAGGTVCVLAIVVVALLIASSGKPSSTTSEGKDPAVVKKDPPKKDPVGVDSGKKEPIISAASAAWNKDARDLVAAVMKKGIDANSGRQVYAAIVNSYDLSQNNRWIVGRDGTRDGQYHLVELRDGRLTESVIDEAGAKKQGLTPRPDSISAFVPPVPMICGGRLATLENPQLAIVSEQGSLAIKGTVQCRTSGKAVVSDVEMHVKRRFFKGNVVHTLVRHVDLELKELPSDRVQVLLFLPTEADLPPSGIGAKPEDNLQIWLSAFVHEPRAGEFQVSNSVPLVVKGAKLIADPNWVDGWNREVRQVVENTLADGVEGGSGRRVYNDLLLGLERFHDVTWSVGGKYTTNKRPWMAQVMDGKLSSREMSDDEVKAEEVEETSLHQRSDGHEPLPLQPLANLSQLDLRIEKPRAGGRMFIGRINSSVLHAQPLRHLSLVVVCRSKKDPADPKSAIGYRNLHLNDRKAELPPSGNFNISLDLPTIPNMMPLVRVHLQAYLTWPRPGFYQISNELAFTLDASDLP